MQSVDRQSDLQKSIEGVGYLSAADAIALGLPDHRCALREWISIFAATFLLRLREV